MKCMRALDEGKLLQWKMQFPPLWTTESPTRQSVLVSNYENQCSLRIRLFNLWSIKLLTILTQIQNWGPVSPGKKPLAKPIPWKQTLITTLQLFRVSNEWTSNKNDLRLVTHFLASFWANEETILFNLCCREWQLEDSSSVWKQDSPSAVGLWTRRWVSWAIMKQTVEMGLFYQASHMGQFIIFLILTRYHQMNHH